MKTKMNTIICPTCKDTHWAGRSVYRIEESDERPVHMMDATLMCEHCGSFGNDAGRWISECKKCGKEVENGSLVGLFVPHLCRDCLKAIVEDQERRGHVCTRCRTVYACCTC